MHQSSKANSNVRAVRASFAGLDDYITLLGVFIRAGCRLSMAVLASPSTQVGIESSKAFG